ncbi:MAG: DNA topoisomerase VI subunit B [Euryarchaeota archaeon]|nr:DNA topoisomerase VI subunit B [Euryarchaeota archaeon]
MVPEPIATELAKKQKEISVAEFFERNKQVLGFDSPTRALITAVKEAVDNALDACEEANVLPDVYVEITPVEGTEDEFRLIIEDNGPGVVKRQIPNVFARLLYGSRFHAIRQTRGQQGIGISAVVLYSQLTTGHHALITSRIAADRPTHCVELAIDTKKNEAEIVSETRPEWDKAHGTRIEVQMVARYVAGRQSVLEYLRSTSIVNPHAHIVFKDPKGQVWDFERATDVLPQIPEDIKPHPHGVERGTILKMARETKARKLSAFLRTEFSSIGSRSGKEILDKAGLKDAIKPKDLDRDQIKALHGAFKQVKVMAPPTTCLSPIGEQLTKRGLKKETVDISPEFIATATRPPAVHSGHPFQIEVGIVYGGKLPKDESVKLLRFANRVPLLYQQGGCGLTKAIEGIDWRRYGLEQRGGRGVPNGPAIFLVHIASSKVPFTSEAKEAVASIEEIEDEVKRAFRDCARHMSRHLRKKEKRAKTSEKFKLISQVLPRIAEKSAKVLEKPVPDLTHIICKIMDVVWIEDKIEYERWEGSEPPEGPKAYQPKPAKKKEAAVGQTTLLVEEESGLEVATNGHVEKSEGKPKGIWITTSTIEVTNYMLKSRKFKLYAIKPEGVVMTEVEPKPSAVEDRYVVWDLPKLGSTEKATLKFSFAGLQKGDFDDNELFVEGINDINVVGADEWHGGD